MKKLIRFLARVSGVENDIINEAKKKAGFDISMLAAWFCEKSLDAQNALGVLGWQMQRGGYIYYKQTREKYERCNGKDFCRMSKKEQDEV